MEEMWKKLIRAGLTPNQFYVLFSIREKETTPLVNTAQELRKLRSNGWLLPDGRLSANAEKVVKEVEGFFKRAKKKTDKVIMGDEFEEMFEKYNALWPKIRLPTGKAARSAKGNVMPGLRWFFENYEYSWDVILKATAGYLDEKEEANWNFCRNSQYFVRKQGTDKSWSSELADYCQLVTDGADDKPNHISDKVF